MDDKIEDDFTQKNKPDDILYILQILIIFIVVCVSMLNLTLQWGNENLWIVILTASMSYIMPNRKFGASTSKVFELKRTNNQSI